MPKAIPLDQHAGLVSLSMLCAGFGKHRNTVTKALAAAGVQPAAKRNGYGVFNLGEAAAAILGVNGDGVDTPVDPRDLPSDKRNAWYSSEQKRIALEAEAGTLIPVVEVEGEMSSLARSVAKFLDTLPDIMERDMGLLPEQVEHMQTLIDRERNKFRDELKASTPILAKAAG